MPENEYFLGVDVGSVSTNLVLLDSNEKVAEALYLRTMGRPMQTIQEGLKILKNKFPHARIVGVGTTGSARQLAATLLGADIVKNEITAHAVAASRLHPGVRTILEIGGQDSKIIILQEGVVLDFAMNTVCAAGTGSFLDQQAARLGIPIEEFGPIAIRSKHPVRIAGRCSVFAESDMIHKQQLGHSLEDILAGLCQAMVRNYLNNVGKNKQINGPILFQGGVAANPGIRKAFEVELGQEITVPQHYAVMGALGAAFLAQEKVLGQNGDRLKSRFRGLQLVEKKFQAGSFECSGCANHCEVVEIMQDGETLARWGDRCGKWSASIRNYPDISGLKASEIQVSEVSSQ